MTAWDESKIAHYVGDDDGLLIYHYHTDRSEAESCDYHGPERRTLVRRRADSSMAGVLRGEVSPYMGEIVED